MLRLPIESINGGWDVDGAIIAMVKSIRGINAYCGGYCGKDQPQMENLYLHLAQNCTELLHRLEDVQTGSDTAAADAVYRAKRLVYRMMNVVQRRMHKGMPEMVAYLMDEQGECPEFICSHSFRPVFTSMLLAPWEEAVALRGGANAFASSLSEPVDLVIGDHDDDDLGAVASTRNARIDYECRPMELADWPFYFFQAGVAVVRRNQKCRLLFSCEHPLCSRLALRVRTKTPWKVPLLYGPSIPSAGDDPVKRATLLTLLLRPWRKVSAL
jgi:hypothetical protein